MDSYSESGPGWIRSILRFVIIALVFGSIALLLLWIVLHNQHTDNWFWKLMWTDAEKILGSIRCSINPFCHR
ncbi:MAG: hypothetical protein JWM46_489 [Candidatus Kaiserbacteria bacterium]|nr:hypothetical protein [Candidatus Kaiserbacteria bacterium]